MKQTRVIRITLIILGFVILLLGWLSFTNVNVVLHELIMAAFSASLSVEMGLIVVNIYVDRMRKKDAVRQLFIYVHGAIADAHNFFVRRLISKHGRKELDYLTDAYMNGGRDADSLSDRQVNSLYNLSCEAEFRQNFNSLKKYIRELMVMSGWNLDATVLESGLAALTSIRLMEESFKENCGSKDNTGPKSVRCDEMSMRKNLVKHILDAYIDSDKLWRRLKEVAAISDN